MIGIFKALFILVAVFSSNVLGGHNSCRQCSGKQVMLFNNHITQDQATSFFRNSIGSCATGGQLNIDQVEADACQFDCLKWNGSQCALHGGPMRCSKWVFWIKVWRYCGNGGAVNITNTQHCSAGVCTTSDTLSMTCNRSVECRGDCNCAQCGC